MIKRINKKIFFRASLLMSGILTFFFNTTSDNAHIIKTVYDMPISSIEKVYAEDGGDSGDCCGCCCDAGGTVGGDSYIVPPSGSGIGIGFTAP